MSDSAGNLKVALADSSFPLGLAVRLLCCPGATRTLACTLSGKHSGVSPVHCGVCAQVLEARGDKGLRRLFARAASFESASNGAATLCVGVRPDCEAYTMVSDGTTFVVEVVGGAGAGARAIDTVVTMTEDTGRAEIS